MEIKIPNMDEFKVFDKKTVREYPGIYILLKDECVKYIGQTSNLKTRLSSHNYLRSNPNEITKIIYLEVNNKVDRMFYEICYYYIYLKDLLSKKVRDKGFRI